MMKTYRATTKFHLGQIRQDVQKGDVVVYDGRNARIQGTWHEMPMVGRAIIAGWLEPAEDIVLPEHEMAVSAKTAPVAAYEPEPLPPPKPEPIQAWKDPTKPHVWEADLYSGTSRKTCKICGVTVEGGPGWGNIDVGKKGLLYTYTDVYNVSIQSMKQLSCPVFIGQTGGAIAEVKENVRHIQHDAFQISNRMDSAEERVARLEGEIASLRQQLIEQPSRLIEMLNEAIKTGQPLQIAPLVEDFSEEFHAMPVGDVIQAEYKED